MTPGKSPVRKKDRKVDIKTRDGLEEKHDVLRAHEPDKCARKVLERCTILYITRDRAFERSIRKVFEARGFDVVCTADALRGIILLQNIKPDLVISDIPMSGLSGFELWQDVNILGLEFQAIPFIFLIGMSAAESRVLGRAISPEDCVMKSAGPRKLADLVWSRLKVVAASPGSRATHVLSSRECEVILWLSRGKNRTEIAEIMAIKSRTVAFHTKNAQNKLGSDTLIGAVAKAVRLKLIGE